MSCLPERTVTQALFDPLPEDVRRRFGLDKDQTGRGTAPKTAKRSDEPDSPLPPARAHAPASPWGFTLADWWQVARRTLAGIGRDRVTSVAGGVTFFGLLALFPAITALVSLYGLVADPATITRHLDMLSQFLPDGALGIIRTQVEAISAAPGTALSFAGIAGLGATLWSANGGMKAVIDALNIAWFERETRGFIRLNLISLGMTVGAILLVIALIATIAVVPAVLKWLPLADQTGAMVSMIRWPIMFAVLMLALAALYRWGPSRTDADWQWISPGALLAAVGLVAVSALFSWYAANFANYNETYGSLGAVIALMMWLWIASIVVLVGAELNAESERQILALNGKPLPRQDRRP
ncbi:MAG: YihY/virulence factor BrkB family protein [Paracoccus sp. (in: a-proteobacteria)]|nr:YihY/virulence factor BrkB family protein [Paracoccus sp. (in: a-proteobacteria)]